MAATTIPEQTCADALTSEMTPKQRRAWRKLVIFFQEPRSDLDWHYQVGTSIAGLRSGEGRVTLRHESIR